MNFDSQDNQHNSRFSTEHLNLLLEMGQINYWEWNVKTDDIYEFGFLGELARSRPNEKGTLKDILARVHVDDREHLKTKLHNAAKENKLFTCEFRVQDLHGVLQWISSRALPVLNADGTTERLRGVGFVITDRKNAEVITSKMERLTQTNVMHEIASLLAHELSNPLTIIKSYVEGCLIHLQQKKFNIDQIVENMKKVSAQVNYLGEITQNVKNYVRKGNLNYEPISVGHLINEAITLFQFKYNNVSFSIKTQMDNESEIIDIDVTQIKQVLLNLIQNSFEAMLQINSNPVIFIKTKNIHRNMMQVCVEDSGPGISEEIINKLFTTCYSTKAQGMGMGLSLCRTIIQAHGGELKIRSNEGNGCCIEFTVPITP